MKSSRTTRPTNHHIENACIVFCGVYHQNFHEESNVEYTHEKSFALQKARKSKWEEVTKALREEVIQAVKINIQHPVHLDDLSCEEKEIIWQIIWKNMNLM